MSSSALVEALDDLASHRTPARVAKSLANLERLVAQNCLNTNTIQDFTRSQDEVDCNIASRLSLHVVYGLEGLQSALTGSEETADVELVADSTIQALNILQGMALLHLPSKHLLGRPYFLRTLLDILTLCRQPIHPTSNNAHDAPTPSSSSASVASARVPLSFPNIALSVLDTLLCLLVDAPMAIRSFELAEGLEGVVKVLKRAESSRDIRVKCLEFLYFYLLPEDGSTLQRHRARLPQHAANNLPPRISSAPRSVKSKFAEAISETKHRNTPFSTPPTSPTKARPSRLQDTPLSNRSRKDVNPRSFPNSPTKRSTSRAHSFEKLVMLHTDVDYVPLSPQKMQVSALGVGRPRLSPSVKGRDTSDAAPTARRLSPAVAPSVGTPSEKRIPRRITPTLGADEGRRKMSFPEPRLCVFDTQYSSPLPSRSRERTEDQVSRRTPSQPPSLFDKPKPSPTKSGYSSPTKSLSPAKSKVSSPARSITHDGHTGTRTIEEKKALLSTWLGNVDALVEGVQRAGVWGLE